MNTLAIICAALIICILTIGLADDMGSFKPAIKVTCIAFWTILLVMLLFKLV